MRGVFERFERAGEILIFCSSRSTSECLKADKSEVDVIATELNKLSAVVIELKASESNDSVVNSNIDSPGEKKKSKIGWSKDVGML